MVLGLRYFVPFWASKAFLRVGIVIGEIRVLGPGFGSICLGAIDAATDPSYLAFDIKTRAGMALTNLLLATVRWFWIESRMWPVPIGNMSVHACSPPQEMSMTASDPVTENDQGTAAEAFCYRVLLGPPTIRTIPIFSLQGEAGRPVNEVWAISTKDKGNTIDKQALGRLRAGAFGDHRFIITRHKQGLREARYATWLAFGDQVKAKAFTTEFPRYGLSNLLADAVRRIGTIEHDIQQGLSKGRFDLGIIDENARYQRAQLYVSSQDKVVQFRQRLSNLQTLGEAVADFRDSVCVG